MTINANALASDYQDARDLLNGQIAAGDVSSLNASAFESSRYSSFISRLDTPQGFVASRSVYPQTDNIANSDWVLVSGAMKSGDSAQSYNAATINHLNYAIYGKSEYQWVPGATLTFTVDYPTYVLVRCEAEIVTASNHTLARTHQLEVDSASDNFQVPSYSAVFTSNNITDDPEKTTHLVSHYEEVGLNVTISGAGHIVGETTPQPSGVRPAFLEWSRRRHSSAFLEATLQPGTYIYGLMIDPRADRVFVGNRSIIVEGMYQT